MTNEDIINEHTLIDEHGREVVFTNVAMVIARRADSMSEELQRISAVNIELLSALETLVTKLEGA